MKRMRLVHLFWMSTALLTIVVFALALRGGRPAALAPAPTPAPHFWSDPSLRTIVIASPADQLEKKNDVLLTQLLEGQLPSGASQATVLSDGNCDPDQNGISHCLNELVIGSTHVLVRHNHDMSKVPCLSPGEQVNIIDVPAFRQM
ncbi:MAG: hypothetical protein IPO81_04890 [Kouleothrix sp.]|nr:hypothetical protein [Kouleothrix sp.]